MPRLEKAAGAFVLRHDKNGIKILILFKPNGEPDIPKGHIEAGENEVQAALREINEETGLVVSFVPGFKEFAEYQFVKNGERLDKELTLFLARSDAGAIKTTEHASYRWLTLKESLDSYRHGPNGKPWSAYELAAKLQPRAFDYMARLEAMEELNHEYAALPSKFKDWNLSKTHVPGEGKLNAKVMFVGQAPGRNEDKLRRPFIGMAGRFLDSVLKKYGIERGDVYITSVVQFFPPKNRVPTGEEVEACKEFLFRQIAIIRPEYVVLLGNVASKTMLGDGEVSKNHGKVVTKDGIHYFITIHPSAAMRFRKVREQMLEDFEQLKHTIAAKQNSSL